VKHCSQGLLLAVAEDLLGSGVPQNHRTGVVNYDKRIGYRIRYPV